MITVDGYIPDDNICNNENISHQKSEKRINAFITARGNNF